MCDEEWSAVPIPVRWPDSGSILFSTTVSTNQDQYLVRTASLINDSSSGIDDGVEAVDEVVVKQEPMF